MVALTMVTTTNPAAAVLTVSLPAPRACSGENDTLFRGGSHA